MLPLSHYDRPKTMKSAPRSTSQFQARGKVVSLVTMKVNIKLDFCRGGKLVPRQFRRDLANYESYVPWKMLLQRKVVMSWCVPGTWRRGDDAATARRAVHDAATTRRRRAASLQSVTSWPSPNRRMITKLGGP